jgi:S1-C subfamily serine protease
MSPVYRRGLLSLGLLLGTIALALASVQRGRESLPGEEIYRRALPGLAWVQSAERARGTGWIIDRRRRWLLTCAHVVGEGETALAIFPARADGIVWSRRQDYLTHLPHLQEQGRAVRGRVIRRSPETDLALVELDSLPAGVEELALAPRGAQPGDRVQVLGNRYDLEVLWTNGSGVVRQVQTLREGYFTAGQPFGKGARVVLADVPINEGDSGGPLLDQQGQVVGVAAAVAWEAQGGGLFIDVSAVRSLLGELPGKEGDKGQESGALAYARGLRGVTLVRYPGGGLSSGVVLDRARRLILTTVEAVGKEETVEVVFPVFQDGRLVAESAFYERQRDLLRKKQHRAVGTVLAVDERRNLALLEADVLPEGVVELRPGKRECTPGEGVHLISNPRRLEVHWLYSAGSIRQVANANLGQTKEEPDPAVLVVQAPLAQSEGGGPILDGRGELAGLVSGKIGPQQQIAFAVSAAEIRRFLDEARPRAAPVTPAEYGERARVFIQARHFPEALRDFTAALALDGRWAPGWSGRGWVRFLRGELALALADAEHALALDAKGAEGWIVRAAVRAEQGQTRDALADAGQALRLDGRSARAHVVRGLAHLVAGQAEQAVAEADEALWLDRKLTLALVVRGRAHLLAGTPEQYDRASADFSQALTQQPDRADLHRWRAQAHRGKNDTKAALADLDAALRCDAGLVEAYRERGELRVRGGQIAAGVADYQECVRRRPALLGSVLAEVQRGMELLVDQDDPGASCTLGRLTLRWLAEMMKERAEMEKRIRAGLAEGERESDLKARARRLLGVVGEVREADRAATARERHWEKAP